MNCARTLFQAAMVVDGGKVCAAPGALLMERNRVVAAGSPQDIGVVEEARVVEATDAVLVPALINVHTHLDLSHIGPMSYPGDFVSWVDLVRSRRAITEGEIAAAVKRGAMLARAGGAAFVGDIAGVRSAAPLAALREAGLPGVSFIEVFGLGRRQAGAIEFIQSIAAAHDRDARGVRLGLQPHAPYSCGLEVYRAAAALGLPLATHLAETPEEIAFVESATGPLAELIQRLGFWDDSISGAEAHPIDHLQSVFAAAPFIAAHLNYVHERHLERLSRWPITVAYCPRASEYFGHRGHRYREMIDGGVRVALGTDSLICLDTPDRISVLDDMRLLHRRDATDPRTLLHMATIAGAEAIGIDPSLVTLSPGAVAGVLALQVDSRATGDPLRQALLRDDAPRWMLP